MADPGSPTSLMQPWATDQDGATSAGYAVRMILSRRQERRPN